MPTIDIKEFNPDGDIKISVAFNIMADIPSIDLSDDKLRMEILELAVNSDDIKQTKDSLLQMITSYKEAPVDHAAAIGDAIIMTFMENLMVKSLMEIRLHKFVSI